MTSNVLAGVCSRLGRKAAVTASAAVMAGAGLITGAGQASAASADITSWDTSSYPFRCTASGGLPTYFCLYYSPGAEGALFRGQQWQGMEILNYNDRFQTDAYGSAGAGQYVLDNAASVENASSRSVVVYSGSNFNGDENWVAPGRGGNLTWWMRNKEESVAVCTWS